MITATCHCGAIRIEVPRRPRRVTDCNCSICRRYGTLWAYYKADTVRVLRSSRAASGYVWGDKVIRFVRCSKCGCVTHWEWIEPKEGSKMGVNARNFEPSVLAAARIRHLDGAATWKVLD
jgi:hypothetical protein